MISWVNLKMCGNDLYDFINLSLFIGDSKSSIFFQPKTFIFMNKLYVVSTLVLILLAGLSANLISNSSGPAAGRSGSPLDNGQTCFNSCHTSGTPVNGGPGSVSISTNIPPEGFMTGTSYQITVSVSEEGKGRFGFQASVYGEQSMATNGTTTITDMARTQKRVSGTNEWVTHAFNGITANAQNSWTFEWIPSAADDSVTFYAAGLAANGRDGNRGDLTYTTSQGVSRVFGVSVDRELAIQQLSVFPSPATDRLFVEFDAEANATAIISLMDLQGREVYRFEDDVRPGLFNHHINIQDLTTGIYTLRASLGQDQISKKVLVK
jgi:hypothetical protein